MPKSRVLVVGGGFAGVACTRRLAGQPEVEVTLLDQAGFHQFQPLLDQVATAELTPGDVRFDLGRMFQSNHNVTTRTGEVMSVDPDHHTATMASGEVLQGDVLVLAAGTRPNFFRVQGVGGGPTGVETAGALSELVHDVMPHRFPHLGDAPLRVILIDTGTALLTQFSEQAHDYSSAQLGRRGVTLRLGVSVQEVTPDEVRLSDGSTILTHLVLWGGGISVNAFHAWADEFYLRPHHRSAELLDPSTIDTPRIDWGAN